MTLGRPENQGCRGFTQTACKGEELFRAESHQVPKHTGSPSQSPSPTPCSSSPSGNHLNGAGMFTGCRPWPGSLRLPCLPEASGGQVGRIQGGRML